MPVCAPGRTPRVTAVLTVYNHRAYVPEAIESVLSQDCDDIELVVVDDGSTEDVESVLRPYMDRIRFVRRDNGGLAAARNTGIELARAEYVAFCDSDDVHLPYRLSAHAALLDGAPEAAQVFSELSTWQDGVVTDEYTLRGRKLGPTLRSFEEEVEDAYGSWMTAREHGLTMLPSDLLDRRVYRGRIPQLIAVYHIAWGGASMYRRAALRAVGGHDPALRRWPDWGLASRLSKSYEQIFLDVPVVLYRQHGGQLTKQSAVGARCYHHVAYDVWKNDAMFSAKHPEVRDRLVNAAAMRMAHVHITEGDWDAAERLLTDAVRAAPLNRRAYTALARSVFMNRVWRRLRPAPRSPDER
jgi:glycosyltransferase involved in cell wall biosynthesis